MSLVFADKKLFIYPSLYERVSRSVASVRPYVRPSIPPYVRRSHTTSGKGDSWDEFEQNVMKLGCSRDNAEILWRTIRKRISRTHLVSELCQTCLQK